MEFKLQLGVRNASCAIAGCRSGFIAFGQLWLCRSGILSARFTSCSHARAFQRASSTLRAITAHLARGKPLVDATLVEMVLARENTYSILFFIFA